MEFHELANLFPLMEGKAFQELTDDIRTNGLMEPITRHEGKILDGRNRYRACIEAGVKPRFIEFDGSVPLANFIVSLNLHRRHLDASQRAMVAARLATMGRGRPENRPKDLFISQPEAASLLNVGESSVKRANAVMRTGTDELVEAVKKGDIPVTRAARIAKLPPAEQRKALEPKLNPPPTINPIGIPGHELPAGIRLVTDAMSYAVMSISQLERIRADDPKQEEALLEVRRWIDEKLTKICRRAK
jgi:hypothetical protein